MPRTTSNGCVYMFSVPSGHFKIGVAFDPEKRRRSLQTGNHLPITFVGATLNGDGPDAYEFERRLHHLLSGCRENGEWFRISYEALGILWEWAWNDITGWQTSLGPGQYSTTNG